MTNEELKSALGGIVEVNPLENGTVQVTYVPEGIVGGPFRVEDADEHSALMTLATYFKCVPDTQEPAAK